MISFIHMQVIIRNTDNIDIIVMTTIMNSIMKVSVIINTAYSSLFGPMHHACIQIQALTSVNAKLKKGLHVSRTTA